MTPSQPGRPSILLCKPATCRNRQIYMRQLEGRLDECNVDLSWHAYSLRARYRKTIYSMPCWLTILSELRVKCTKRHWMIMLVALTSCSPI
jgi:hypothetical protein